MKAYDSALVDAFLAHHWKYRPIDASFMGAVDHDSRLPPAYPQTAADELAEIGALLSSVASTTEPEDLGDRFDRRLMLSELTVRQASRSRLDNPAWYTGEAAFGVVSLLLPQSTPVRHDALLARLEAIPGFLASARANLEGKAIPKGWVTRARREAEAAAEFLRSDIHLHEVFDERWTNPGKAAAVAFQAFSSSLVDTPDADPAIGEEALALIMQQIHGLTLSVSDAIEMAQDAFDRAGRELKEMAATIDPGTSCEDQLAALSVLHPASADAVIDSYRQWDARALAAASGLVTPALDYGLDYRWIAPCFRKIFSSLYFLFYRSPPALKAGTGSVYWVLPPGEDLGTFLRGNATAMIKIIHAVHHGSIGHHTQNRRARQAASRLARVAGTDCALGLAFLGAGTLVEGWACYVQDLLMEVPGFYTPAEILLLKQFERRNAASVLVDINLHSGEWSMNQAMAFYRDEAGFAPGRVESEVVRNSMLPGSRLMYWFGVEGIKALRKRWKGETLDFHDILLSFGHVPLAWIGEEMEREGLLEP